MLRFSSIAFLMLALAACSPTEKQKKLMSEIEQSLPTMQQETFQFEGTATYLAKEQSEYDSINAALKKARKGKADSLFNLHVKAHKKVLDSHNEHLEKAKSAVDGLKTVLEKLKQPLNFTHNTELIEEDFTHYDVMFVEAKPILEKSKDAHEEIEKLMKARLAAIEEEKQAEIASAELAAKSAAKNSAAKNSANKGTTAKVKATSIKKR
jgi:hypothetical protein